VDREVRGVEDLLAIGLLALGGPQDNVAAGDVRRVEPGVRAAGDPDGEGVVVPGAAPHEDLGAARADEAEVGLARLGRLALALIGDLLRIEESAGDGVPVEGLRVLLGVLGALTKVEAAEALSVSRSTVATEWRLGLAWLNRRLEGLLEGLNEDRESPA